MTTTLEKLCVSLPLNIIVEEIENLIEYTAGTQYIPPSITKNEGGLIIKTNDILAGQHVWYIYYLDWITQYSDILKIITEAKDKRDMNKLKLLSNEHVIYCDKYRHTIHPTVFNTIINKLKSKSDFSLALD